MYSGNELNLKILERMKCMIYIIVNTMNCYELLNDINFIYYYTLDLLFTPTTFHAKKYSCFKLVVTVRILKWVCIVNVDINSYSLKLITALDTKRFIIIISKILLLNCHGTPIESLIIT